MRQLTRNYGFPDHGNAGDLDGFSLIAAAFMECGVSGL
jgi:hypothetical protein